MRLSNSPRAEAEARRIQQSTTLATHLAACERQQQCGPFILAGSGRRRAAGCFRDRGHRKHWRGLVPLRRGPEGLMSSIEMSVYTT
jgi:hypothetical protein